MPSTRYAAMLRLAATANRRMQAPVRGPQPSTHTEAVTPSEAITHQGGIRMMSHLLPGSTATPDVGSAPSALGSTRPSTREVLVTSQELAFSTAAAISVPPSTIRRRRLGAWLSAAIGRIRIGLPEPRPHYPRRDRQYFDAARMSRAMDRL